ncbi:vWA domain-containing protein [Stratiformator vulcanicus]|uniref:VWFA domain-containing protein n=1 Tax=Stratiformator vulcanicus TaxID=2527980 RepID=A0A517R0I8_9PLAN|nr:BatA and WFA domain-containing protein [Stratiformator vulcanicus]QDT37340.1 hypothetical protein Pan189_17130 [Stratiformator vulcanicus]
MSSFNFLAPIAGLLALLAIPVIIFYFLKLRRPRALVPSLVLWQQVLNDQRVNSPFQKFKQNLLLLLQLLILAAICLAAMQPVLSAAARGDEAIPLIIDCSASMAALDESGGETRLDIAKRRARAVIDGLLPGQVVSLIAGDRTARQLTPFTSDQRMLRSALEDLKVTPVESDPTDALRMAVGLSRTAGSGGVKKAVFITDGNLPEEVSVDLPFDLVIQKVEPGGRNLGLTSFNARPVGESAWEVFVEASVGGADRASGTIVVKNGEELLVEEDVVPEAETPAQITFRVATSEAVELAATVVPSGFDSIEIDNKAWIALPKPKPLDVYCPTELESFRQALAVSKGIRLFPGDGVVPEEFDLLVSNDAADEDSDARVRVFIDVLPDDLRSIVAKSDDLVSPVDWLRGDPLLTYVTLEDVQISNAWEAIEGVADADFEALGYEPIVSGRRGPLIVKRRENFGPTYRFLFDINQSTLPYRLGFPIMASNLVTMARVEAKLNEARGNSTGLLPTMTVPPGERVAVTRPDGKTESAVADAAGSVSGLGAPLVGLYRIDTPAGARSIGVALLSARETGLDSTDNLRFREIDVEVGDAGVGAELPLWPYFAVGALVFILFEWWYFHRRPAAT